MNRGLPQLSEMKSFAVIINGSLPPNIIANFSILDVCRILGYDSGKSPLELKVSSKSTYKWEAWDFFRKCFEKISRKKFLNNLKRATVHNPCRKTCSPF